MYKILFLDKDTGRQAYRQSRRLYETKEQFDKWWKHFRAHELKMRCYDIVAFKLIGSKWKPVKK